MSYYTDIIIALWKPDYVELLKKATEYKDTFVGKMITNAKGFSTPDETYMVMESGLVEWNDVSNPAVKFIMNFIKPIRHAMLSIDEFNRIETDFEEEDDRGVDEEFSSMLSTEVSIKVMMFGQEV